MKKALKYMGIGILIVMPFGFVVLAAIATYMKIKYGEK